MDDAEKTLLLEHDSIDKMIQLIENTPDLLKMPFGMRNKRTINLFKSEFYYTKKMLKKEMALLFECSKNDDKGNIGYYHVKKGGVN